MLIPFSWMISTSLKTAPENIAVPHIWILKALQWRQVVKAWNEAPFGLYYLHSNFVTVVTTVGQLYSSILAAFAFTRLKLVGQNILFNFFLGTMMIPGEMLNFPHFDSLSHLGTIDQVGALILPWLASFFTVYSLRTTYSSTPELIYYAAQIDGASDWKYSWQVLVLMRQSTNSAVTVLLVIGTWNAYLWPLIDSNSDKMRTLPVGLQAYYTDAGTTYTLLMAASTFDYLLMVILYIFLQKYIIAGI